MTLWTIEPMPLHRVLVPGPEVFFQREFGVEIELVIYAFVLRNALGNVCLVDTGLGHDHAELDRDVRARKGPRSGFVDIEPALDSRAKASKLDPDTIVLTSFGPYTIGGLALWPDAPVHASARGLRDLDEPEEPAFAHRVSASHRERLARAIAVHERMQVLPGLVLTEVGIHHPASMAVLVDTAQGRVAIVDPVFTARNLREGVALGASGHAAGWHAMVRQLDSQCSAIIPIHDSDPTPVHRSSWHATIAAGGL